MVQVFGYFGNYHSFAAVTRAYCKEVHRAGLPMLVWAIDPVSEFRYLDCPYDVGMSDDVGVAIAYPTVALEWLAPCRKKVLVTVCETSRIPQDWVDACNKMDLVVVPSNHCLDAFTKSGVHQTVIVANHGVYPAPWQQARELDPNNIKLLHVSGSASFHLRKGTGKLLVAFQNLLKKRQGIHLTLRCASSPGLRDLIAPLNGAVTIQESGLGLSPVAMSQYLYQFDAVVQPSRAEGFGLVPLEAAASGVPAVLTEIGGHDEYIRTPIAHIPIPVSDLREPLATQGNASGFAPTVSTAEIEQALERCIEDIGSYRVMARSCMNRVAQAWNWGNRLSGVIGSISELHKQRSRFTAAGRM